MVARYKHDLFQPNEKELTSACADLQEAHDSNSDNGISIAPEVGMIVAQRKIDSIVLRKSTVANESLGGHWSVQANAVEVGKEVLRSCIKCDFYDNCPAIAFLENAADMPTYQETVLRDLQNGLSKALTNEYPDNVIVTGGVALRLHGISRRTSDLDLDFISTNKEQLFTQEEDQEAGYLDLGDSVRDFLHQQEESGAITGSSFSRKKDTNEKYKLNLGYTADDVSQGGTCRGHMKFEAEFIDQDSIDLDRDTEIIDGIRVYTLEKLLLNKVEAITERVKVRDYADLTFIIEKNPALLECLSDDSLEIINDRFVEVLDILTDEKRDISRHFDDYLELPAWLRNNRKFGSVLLDTQALVDTSLAARKLK